MHQATVDKLRTLRLLGMLEAWQEQQTTPTYHDLSFDERFSLLVDQEHLRRENQRRQRRLKNARLASHVSLSEVDFTVARGLSKTQFLELTQGQWVHDGLHLIVVGSTGVGKTFLASVLATQLCQQGQPVRYFKTAELLLEWKLAKADGSFPKFQKQLAAYSLLILDDWLRDPCSAKAQLKRSCNEVQLEQIQSLKQRKFVDLQACLYTKIKQYV